jgi:hypothetical protein
MHDIIYHYTQFYLLHAISADRLPQTRGRTVTEVFISAWSRFPFEELTVAQLDDKLLPFMKL